MFCPNCGKELEAGAAFCTECGTKVEVEAEKAAEEVKEVVEEVKETAEEVKEAVVEEPVQAPAEEPVVVQEPAQVTVPPVVGAAATKADEYADKAVKLVGPISSKKVLIFGIVSLALAILGLSLCYCYFIGVGFAIVALVFSAITLKMVKKYTEANGPVSGMAKVGKILATVALPLAIIGVILGIIVSSCVICVACNAARSSYYHYW